MRLLQAALVLVLAVQMVVGPPVTANKKGEGDKKSEEESKGADWDIGLEYNRYLQEVVQALESDPEFRTKLEKAEVADIRTGKIASELEYVNHNVRSKLDELKRQELERLRHLAVKEYEIKQAQRVEHEGDDDDDDENEINHDPKMKVPYHLDHHNPHSFEIEDLRKLIVQTTKDLEEADKQRREEFKEYEMQKEYEKNQQLNMLDEEHKKEYEHKIEEQEKKHKKHPSLHHPGSKQQLEEVWEEQDHMNPEDFNPKTFFHMHDLDGNGVWDTDEVKALFQKELDKMYDPNAPEDDMRERREEMERMREHVFSESDTNKDHLISFEEFLQQTKKKEFEQDQGWQGLDDQKLYTHEEYLEFEKKRQEEVQRLIAQGMLPPQPHDMHMPYGIQVPPEYFHHQQQQQMHHPQLAPHQMPQQQGHHAAQQQQGFHPPPGHDPNAYQQHPPQYQNQQYHQQPPQQQQYHPPPPQYQQQQHPNQVPVQQHPNQAPVQQHPNQVPVQQHPNQVPVQQHPNQVPVQQHPNQVPVQQQHYQNPPPVQQNQPQAQQYQNQPQAQQQYQNPPQGQQQYQNQPPPAPQQQYQNQVNANPPQPPVSGAPQVQQQPQQNVGQQPPVQHNAPPMHNQQQHPQAVHNSPPSHKP